MLTLLELKELLAARYSECDLLDLMEIDSYMLVEAFSELIEEKQEWLAKELEEVDNEG